MAARKKKTADIQENLETDNSEIAMNTNADLPEGQVTDGADDNADAEPSISLDANLSIQNVVALYERIKKSYAAFDTLEIDASKVAAIDTASFQLLVALKKDAAKQEKEVIITAPSARFIESAGLLGLLEILDVAP
jgi:ABC-type transporter Mla MlaB component